MQLFERIDSLLKSPLNEVNIKDSRGDVFGQFVKEWKRKRRAGETKGVYVNFSNHGGDKLIRTASPSPDHSDPVGVYGYPIDYVLDYPADVRYGARAKYLKILRSTSKRTLDLQRLTQRTASELLKRVGFSPGTYWMNKVIKRYNRIKPPKKYAKAFMSVIQMEFDPEDPDDQGNIRSGKEQTKLFRKMGFDAIEDSARDQNSAVINDREPEQIVFLNRKAFRVEQIYTLRGDDEKGSLVSSTPTDKQMRKLAVEIAREMGDRLSDGGRRHKITRERIQGAEISTNIYWTEKGRQIGIRTDHDAKLFQKLKIGEKPHREYKKSDPYVFRIELQTEYGAINHVSGHKDTFDDIARDIADKLSRKEATGVIDDWSPIDRESAIRSAEKKKERETKARISKKRKKFEKEEWPLFVKAIKDAASKLGEPVRLPDNYAIQNDVYLALNGLSKQFFREKMSTNTDDYEETFDKLWDENAPAWEVMGFLDDLKKILPIVKPALVRGGAEGFGFPYNIKNAEL